MAAPVGNKYNQEWTLENARPRFEDALEYAHTNDECLCMQDAVAQTGIPTSTFYYLVDNQKELELIKQDINSEIIRRINRFALDRINPAPASPSIWRMKQLGEKDEQHIKQTGSMENKVVVTDQKTAEEVQKMIDKFGKEKE